MYEEVTVGIMLWICILFVLSIAGFRLIEYRLNIVLKNQSILILIATRAQIIVRAMNTKIVVHIQRLLAMRAESICFVQNGRVILVDGVD